MPRPEGELGPGDPEIMEFAAGLRLLREKAGRPGYRELARRAHFSATTLSEAAGGRRLPTLAVTLAYVAGCGGNGPEWEERWRRAARSAAPGTVAGRVSPDPDGIEQEVPYQGLAAYGPERAEWFFGREDLVDDLLRRLTRARLVAVFGASGSGKSSLLRAGLVPAALGGRTPKPEPAAGPEPPSGPTPPVVLVLTPGADPVGELAVRLARMTGVPAGALRTDLATEPAHLHLAIRQAVGGEPADPELWLVVDQFEEVFTLCRDGAAREHFVAALLAATRAPDSRLRVVLGVRADFYGRCAELPDLPAALTQAQVLLGPMTPPQVRDAVVRPAERAGAMVEGALVSTIVAQVAGRAGALPMASHALLEAWWRRRGNAVTLAGYEAAGGMDGAVAQTAERVWQEFDTDQRRAARQVLLRMVEVGTGDEPVTSRRLARDELDDADAVTASVLERLAGARLVTVDGQSVRVAHEALLDAWPRLRDWLDEDREGVRTHRQLTQAAAVWQSLDHDPGALLRGLALSRTRIWADAQPGSLTRAEREFLAGSQRADELRLTRRRRRSRVALGTLAGVAAVVTVLASLAVVQAGRAADQRDNALHGQLVAGARAQMERDPQLAFLLAREAYRFRPDVRAETVLRQATLNWRELSVRSVFGPRNRAAALTRDGRHAVAGTPDGTVRVWHATDSSPGLAPALPDPGTDLRTVAISGDGRWVAASYNEPVVRIWDSSAPDRGPVLLPGHTGPVRDVRFSPDARYLASGDADGTVRLWDLSGTPAVPRVMPYGGRGGVFTLAWSADGRRLAAGTGLSPARIWDLTEPGRPPVELVDSVDTDELLFSPDGTRVAGGQAGTLRIWAASGDGEPTVLGRLRGVTPATFSPDGQRLITTNGYGVLGFWDTTVPGDPLPLRGHAGAVRAATVGSDGHLVSVGEDGTVRSWDIDGPFHPDVTHPHGDLVHVARFSPDGRHLATGGIDDGLVRITTVASPLTGDTTIAAEPASTTTLPGHSGMVLEVAFAPDGTRLATLDSAGTVRIWAWPTGTPTATFDAAGSSRLVFGPDSHRLLTSGPGGVRVWDGIESGTPNAVPLAPAGSVAAFAPDGRHVVTGAEDGTVSIRPASAGTTGAVALGRHDGAVTSVSYRPGGGSAASLGLDSTIRIWPVDGGAATLLAAAGQGAATTRLTYTPDGRHLALLGGGELTGIQLWAADPGATEPVTLHPLGPGPLGFAFSPDGGRAATVHSDGSVRTWDCDVCGPVDRVLAAAATRRARSFTPDERRAFLLDR
ncbi:nSTAND1 domain-containing NTPase [Micromonospora sp. NPDC004704]